MAVMTSSFENRSMDRNAFVNNVIKSFADKFSSGEVVGLRVLLQAEPLDLKVPGEVLVETDWDSQALAQKNIHTVADILSCFCDEDKDGPSVKIFTRRVSPVERG